MDSQLKISVVIPSYNQAAYLRQCLDSVFSQNYENLEVIVMDGGSTDGSLEIFADYRDRCTYFQSEPDGGQIAALNKGLFEIATGDILTWLNTDDYWTENVLAEVNAAINPRAERWIVCGRSIWVIDPDNQQYAHPFFGSRTHDQIRRFWRDGTLPQCSVFFHRTIMEKAGKLDLQETLGFDYQYWLRLTRLPGVQIYFIDRVLSYYRQHQNAKTVMQRQQSHYDLERVSRQFWPSAWLPSGWKIRCDYWFSKSLYKPQEQDLNNLIWPSLKQAAAQKNYRQFLRDALWMIIHCPSSTIEKIYRYLTWPGRFPIFNIFSRRLRFQQQVKMAILQQTAPLIQWCAEATFNLHPPMPQEPPTRVVIPSNLFRRARIALQFQANVPDARSPNVLLLCRLETLSGENISQEYAWELKPGKVEMITTAFENEQGVKSQLIFETRVASDSQTNAHASTLIIGLQLVN